ncbi:hypothetical protein ACI2KR_07540 [Pseudomonas luteola]
MNQSSYKFDPTFFASLCEAYRPTILHKGILFEALNLCWSSPSPGHCDITSEELAAKLDVRHEDVRETIDLFAATEFLVEEFDLESLSIRLKSPFLINQHKENVAEIEKANRETRKAKRVREISEKNLLKLVTAPNISEIAPRVGYLDFEERDLTTYKGWLPTIRFTKCGEVYRVTEDYIAELQAKFPSIKINEQIVALHGWLSRNPTKRRPLAQVPAFIEAWLERNWTKPNESLVRSQKNTNQAEAMDMKCLDDALKQLMG